MQTKFKPSTPPFSTQIQTQLLVISQIKQSKVEQWLKARKVEGLSATTRNKYVTAARSFLNWCVKAGKLANNSLSGIPKADEDSDRRHVRRSLASDELTRLLQATRWRPLAEIGRQVVHKAVVGSERPHASWNAEPLTMESVRCGGDSPYSLI